MLLKKEKISMENFNTNSSQKIFWAYQNLINQINKKINHIKNYSNEEILNSKKTINFMDSNLNWSFTTFETNIINKLECPNIKNKNWSFQNQKGEEIRNLIFQSEEDIDYNIVNCEIKSSFILKGESTFWIFLRSNNCFSLSTVAICFSKEEYSQRIHLCLGIFYKNFEGNLTFRIFNKQQLIFSEDLYKENEKNSKNEKYEKNDTIFVNTKIFDTGNQNLVVSTTLNESKYENIVKGNFFLPFVEEKYKIMIAGSGHQCKIKTFVCNTIYKPEYSQNEPILDGNGCGCCTIF